MREEERGVGRRALLGTKWFIGDSVGTAPTPTEPFVWHTHIYIHTSRHEFTHTHTLSRSVVDCGFQANDTPVYTHTHACTHTIFF